MALADVKKRLSLFALIGEVRAWHAERKTFRQTELAEYQAHNRHASRLHTDLSEIARVLNGEKPQLWEYRKPYARGKEEPPTLSDRWAIAHDAQVFHDVMSLRSAVIAIPLEKTPFSFFGNTTQRLALAFKSRASGDEAPQFDVMHAIRFRGRCQDEKPSDELLCLRRGPENLQARKIGEQYAKLLCGEPSVLTPRDFG